ncbi:LSU ribosomal protein L30E [Ignisphaera aggregans DSM 17230]|uniref:Large ribosomal subunit protein eL30 n=1 Tax=Ignisphaera aggregans (strain DSM 17230 / JCM 13409 / AQ1.S1) TaxID=583356 RepID=E0SPC1_IGNAA|nr:LSU ribosomal protein L30E [Ignisphaera aggregans DSM 17230]
MASQSIDNILRFVVRTGKIVIGSKNTIKLLKLGALKYVVISSNVPENIRQDIEYYSKLSNIPIIVFPGTNRELGTVLGKPFSVAVMGIIDPGQITPEILNRFIKQ